MFLRVNVYLRYFNKIKMIHNNEILDINNGSLDYRRSFHVCVEVLNLFAHASKSCFIISSNECFFQKQSNLIRISWVMINPVDSLLVIKPWKLICT